MKKIKLVVSDLHFGIGKSNQDGSINLLEEFSFDDKFVEFLDFYTTNEYKKTEIELILNGDILNYLQIDYKGHFLTVITEDISLNKTQRIVKGHPKVFDALKSFVARKGCEITYVMGNHDQDILWPKVREYLNNVLDTNIKFKNFVYAFDGVHIEHGHMHEAANRFDVRKFYIKKNIPEPILNIPLGSHFFVELVLRIKQSYPYVDKIRPFDRMIRWAIFNETLFTFKWFGGIVKYIFRILFYNDARSPVSFRKLIKVFRESAVFPDLAQADRKILDAENTKIVIFGHTHVYQFKQWKDNKQYFNTGTWTDLTSLDISSLGKITKLTYVLLEYDEENEKVRGSLKEWNGYHKVQEDVSLT